MLTRNTITIAYHFAGRVPGEAAFHAYMSADKCLGSHEVFVFDREASYLLTLFIFNTMVGYYFVTLCHPHLNISSNLYIVIILC